MRTQVTTRFTPNEISEAALAASRQVWLAGLGAAVVSRDWIATEAGNRFKTLVKEGTAVESRAIQFIGDQLGTSMTRANALWKQTRSTVQTTVRQAADTAVLFVKDTLPVALPLMDLPAKPKAKRAATTAKRSIKSARKPLAVKAKRVVSKRTAKRVAR